MIRGFATAKQKICGRISSRNFLGSIIPKEKTRVTNSKLEIERALNEPIGTRRLREIAKTGKTAAIVVDDAMRATPSRLMVPPLLTELNAVGIKHEDITVIFGCGSHRTTKLEEMEELVGTATSRRDKAISHDHSSGEQVLRGRTSLGTEVYVNRLFVEADVKILAGDINLHYFAGYGGGRKSVLPAVSGAETIQQNHALLLHPKASTGVLAGNPVHEDMVEAAKLAKVDFILNIVTNSKQELVQAYAGDLEHAFYEGTKLVDEMYKVKLEQRANIVVVSAGGNPFDINLFQAYKAIDNALKAVARKGVIVLVAKCPEGYGNEVFHEWMTKFPSFKSMEKEVKKCAKARRMLGEHKAYYLMKTMQKTKIILVSSMSDQQAVDAFKLRTAESIEDALKDA